MKTNKTWPDRRTLEAGFLILSLLPHRGTALGTIKEAAGRFAEMRMRMLRDTSDERCAVGEGRLMGGAGFGAPARPWRFRRYAPATPAPWLPNIRWPSLRT